MKYDHFDKMLFDSFQEMPSDTVHPSIKVEVMQHIEHYRKELQKESVFSNWFLRISEAVMLATLLVLIGFTPTLLRYARSGTSNNVARLEVADELYVTNRQSPYFSDTEPDYSLLQTVKY